MSLASSTAILLSQVLIVLLQEEPMEMDQVASYGNDAAANGTLPPAEGTSISPYGTRRSTLIHPPHTWPESLSVHSG